MIPNFEIFGKTVSFYMLIITVALLILLFFTYREAKKNGLDEINMLCAMLIGLASALVGAHLLYGITQLPLLIKLIEKFGGPKNLSEFWQWLQLIFGGAVFYGGLLGGLLGGGIYLKKKKLSVRYADVAACGIPLFHFFGRLGCFFSGCCYGVECSFGVTYHHHYDEAVNGITRFPVQLMEALFNLILFFVLFYMFRKKKQSGKLLLWYLIAYPLFRFCDEFLRGDNIRGHWGPFSTSQIISLLILAVTIPMAVVSLVKEKKNGPKTE